MSFSPVICATLSRIRAEGELNKNIIQLEAIFSCSISLAYWFWICNQNRSSFRGLIPFFFYTTVYLYDCIQKCFKLKALGISCLFVYYNICYFFKIFQCLSESYEKPHCPKFSYFKTFSCFFLISTYYQIKKISN